MAPVPLKRILSVSSEDPQNPASSLLSCAGRKWLCATDNKSRRAEVVLELSKRTRIASIALGNFGSAFVEVLVGDSASLDSEEYITLLPQSTLMTVPDSRRGKNKTRSVTYGREKLSSAAATKKWNQVKIKCRQPYNLSDQFGLQFVAFFSDTSDSSSNTLLTSPRLLSPTTPSTPKLESHPPSTDTTPESENLYARQKKRLPTHPTFKSPMASSTKGDQVAKTLTPKRPLKNHSNDDDEDFEFSGIEKQSRLFQNALRGNSSNNCSERTNPILEKIMSEREKYKSNRHSGESATCDMYQRRKLLKKELPKAETSTDFAASYDESKSKHAEVAVAMNKFYVNDNEYEIGQEPENTWGWGRGQKKGRKRNSVSHRERAGWKDLGGWLTKRKKINGMIDQCWAILDKAGAGDDGCVSESPDRHAEVTTEEDRSTDLCDCGDDSDTTVICDYDGIDGATSGDDLQGREEPVFMECPLCEQLFPEYAIEVHASSCGDELSSVSSGNIPIVVD